LEFYLRNISYPKFAATLDIKAKSFVVLLENKHLHLLGANSRSYPVLSDYSGYYIQLGIHPYALHKGDVT
jgi:hypothetical protein